MKFIFIAFTLLLMGLRVSAEPVVPESNFIPGWEWSGESKKFLKNDLYGHIDGGAELFLEFGFERLIVQGYIKDSLEITLEIYRMTEPAAALGIYLMKCGREIPFDDIHCRNTGNPYQLTLVRNDCFIQVNSFSGRDNLIPVMTRLANKTLEGIETGDTVRLFDYLPVKDLIEGSELLIRGPFGLQPIYTFGEGDIFQLNGDIFGVAGDYQSDTNKTYTVIIIPYPDDGTARKAFLNLNGNLDTYLEVVEQSEGLLIFRDYLNKYGQVLLDKNILRIKINLPDKP